MKLTDTPFQTQNVLFESFFKTTHSPSDLAFTLSTIPLAHPLNSQYWSTLIISHGDSFLGEATFFL